MLRRRVALAALGLLPLGAALPGAAGTAGPVAYRFSFEQAGPPKEVGGANVIDSHTVGQGTVTLAAALRTTDLEILSATVRPGAVLTHVDKLGATTTVRLTLRALGGTLAAFGDGSRLLLLRVGVLQSSDPACPRGQTGRLELLDAARGSDAIRLYLCPTAHEHYYENLPGQAKRVRVAIG